MESSVMLGSIPFLYNRTSAVVRVPPVSRGRRANPVLTYITALRRFLFCMLMMVYM